MFISMVKLVAFIKTSLLIVFSEIIKSDEIQ